MQHQGYRWRAQQPAPTLTTINGLSTVKGDNTDNYFLEQLGRFPTIEEDQAKHRLLVKDYA